MLFYNNKNMYSIQLTVAWLYDYYITHMIQCMHLNNSPIDT